MTRSTKLLLICCGTASVGIGVVGVFVLLLPTTPFLLLAAFLYARNSKRCYDWLMRNRLVGDSLCRYYEGRSVRRIHKVLTVSFLWIVLALTAALAVEAWWVRDVLAGVGIAVTTHLLLLPSERSGHKGTHRNGHKSSLPVWSLGDCENRTVSGFVVMGLTFRN